MVNISQSEVQEFLEKHKGAWFSTKQISKVLKITEGTCCNNLSRLRRHSFVEMRGTDKPCKFEYSYKEDNTMIRKKPLPIKELKDEVGE